MVTIAVSISLPSARFLRIGSLVTVALLAFGASVWIVRKLSSLSESSVAVHTIEEKVPVLNQRGIAPFRASVRFHVVVFKFLLEVELRVSYTFKKLVT